jgi:chorismate mutase
MAFENNKIDLFREQIENTDREILYLVKRRMQISKKMAVLKFEKSLEVKDFDREKELMKKNLKIANSMTINETFIYDLFSLIFDNSKKIQEEKIEKLKEKKGLN